MSTETVTITNTPTGPVKSLEQEATELGIDITNIDPTAVEQGVPTQKILGKFENQAALEAAYTELERKLSAKPKDTGETDQGDEETDPEVPEDDDAATGEADDANDKTAEELAREATDKAGLDLGELSNKFWANGEKLDEADYKKLETAGYTRDLVDQFTEGQKAIISLQRNTVFNAVGGETQYKSIIEWAGSNLSEAEVKAYDEAVNSKDMNKVMLAVNGLKGRFDNKRGVEPRLLDGRPKGNAAASYASVEEMKSDMRDPKYQNDPAFRARVANKIQNSSVI